MIGASEKAHSVGSTLMLNLVQSGFQGELFSVNPRHRTIHGIKTLHSILKAEHSIDLAVIATPIENGAVYCQRMRAKGCQRCHHRFRRRKGKPVPRGRK